MKSITHLLAVAIAATTVLVSAPAAQATDLTLEGTASYKIANKIKYYVKPGPSQSGRFSRLGKGYYQKTTYGFDYIYNNDRYRSGDLSLEFWAMPYYGATSGQILMTRGKNPIKGRKHYDDASPTGQAVSPGKRAYPEINLWEYTREGWVNRDAYTFTRKTSL